MNENNVEKTEINFTGTVYYNHKHGCQKCTIDGIFINRRMTFPHSDCPLRTDQSFRAREEPQHHRETSIIERLPIDMIRDFVVADSLHLLELGVMKRLIITWRDGLKNYQTKWTNFDIFVLNKALYRCNKELPKEIHRKFRPVDKLSFWKGTEFRTMLLYTGIVVFKKVLTPNVFSHFLTLFAATTICNTKAYRHFLPLARHLFNDFIEMYSDLYGNENIVSNIHNLCHVVDDVERFGELPLIGTYPFENKLRIIKLKLKQCNKVLEQAANRIVEESALNISTDCDSTINGMIAAVKYPFLLPGSDITVHKQILVRAGFTLSNRTFGDMWFTVHSRGKLIFKFAYAKKNEESVQIFGFPLRSQIDYFDMPFRSSSLNIFKSDCIAEESCIPFPAKELKCKFVCFSLENEFVFLPLLHTL